MFFFLFYSVADQNSSFSWHVTFQSIEIEPFLPKLTKIYHSGGKPQNHLARFLAGILRWGEK